MGTINRLISSKIIVGDMIASYGIELEDESLLYDYISMGMQIMELKGYYIRKVKKLKVKNGMTDIPCDIDHLAVVLGTDKSDEINVNSITYQNSIEVEYVAKDVNFKNVYRIPIRNTYITGLRHEGIISEHSYYRGYVNNNKLYFNFDEGEVIIIYFGLPCDCEGYPMIIDNAYVRQALPFYILWRLILGGYKHPTLSLNDVYSFWNRFYPQARNAVHYPDFEELQNFTETYNNPLIGDMVNYYFDR